MLMQTLYLSNNFISIYLHSNRNNKIINIERKISNILQKFILKIINKKKLIIVLFISLFLKYLSLNK
jgi:predicted transcriptional regulator